MEAAQCILRPEWREVVRIGKEQSISIAVGALAGVPAKIGLQIDQLGIGSAAG